MISSLTSILSAALHRFAKPRSATAACKSFRFAMLSLILACCCASQSYAAENLECPEIGTGRVPDLIGDATGSGLVTTGNRVELVNEINYLINKLQLSEPNISSSDMVSGNVSTRTENGAYACGPFRCSWRPNYYATGLRCYRNSLYTVHATGRGDAPSFVEMARAVVALGVTKRLSVACQHYEYLFA
jgi:hypothetical protein